MPIYQIGTSALTANIIVLYVQTKTMRQLTTFLSLPLKSIMFNTYAFCLKYVVVNYLIKSIQMKGMHFSFKMNT